MANIASLLAAIKNAVYGEEVRDAIHDSIEAINNDFTTRLNEVITNTSGQIYSDIQAQSRDAAIRPLFTITNQHAFVAVVFGANGYIDFKQSPYHISDNNWSPRGVLVRGLHNAVDGDWYYVRSYGDIESTIPLLIQKKSDTEFVEFGTGQSYFSCYLKAHVSGSDRWFTVYSTMSEDDNYKILGDTYTRATTDDPWSKTGVSDTILGTGSDEMWINLIINKSLSLWKITPNS